MIGRLGLAAIAIAVLGCAPSFAATNPTVQKLREIGYRCSDGEKDDVPSGLYQWRCPGPDGDTDVMVLTSGNAKGVAEVDLALSTNDAVAIRQAYESVIAKVPPLTSATELHGVLDGWSGPQTFFTVRGMHVVAECDSVCFVGITNATSPLEPLPLP
jgi:hypothetical protein